VQAFLFRVSGGTFLEFPFCLDSGKFLSPASSVETLACAKPYFIESDGLGVNFAFVGYLFPCLQVGHGIGHVSYFYAFSSGNVERCPFLHFFHYSNYGSFLESGRTGYLPDDFAEGYSSSGYKFRVKFRALFAVLCSRYG